MQAKYSISLLSILSAAAIAAEPGVYGREGGGDVRAVMLESAALERSGATTAQVTDRRRSAEYAFPSGTTTLGIQGAEAVTPASENARRQGRLSPEQRRTLRQQINEVGHDIYQPQR